MFTFESKMGDFLHTNEFAPHLCQTTSASKKENDIIGITSISWIKQKCNNQRKIFNQNKPNRIQTEFILLIWFRK